MPVHVLTDLSPAPDELLKMIRCNCHTDCSSMRCTCKKYIVKCSLFVETARERAAPTRIPQSMKKAIQIPTLNESKTYHLYTQENKFCTNMAMVKVQVYSNAGADPGASKGRGTNRVSCRWLWRARSSSSVLHF